MPATESQLPLLIGDARVQTAGDLVVRNPWDGSTVARVAMGDASHLDKAIEVADRALDQTRAQPPHERAALLLRVAEEIEKRKAELANLIVAEAGKPIVLAEGEVARAVVTFTSAADEARRWPGESLDAGAFSPGAGYIAISKRVAAGVVYGMSPFNFPLNLVAHKLAPAIACGASIVLKPSPRTPLSALALAKIILDAGAIPGQVNVITVPNDLATRPIDDPRVKVVSFTGSAPIGWAIKQKALKQKVTLELGGNAAVIVHEDAIVEEAVPMIAAGIFANAGQSCISVQRVIVHRSIYDRFKSALVTYTKEKIHAGDPARRDVLVGPMITAEARDKVIALIDSAQAKGARLLTGGKIDGPCVEPTLLENAPADHDICREEAFAPLAVLSAYDSFDDALKQANDSPYGLQAGVFTHDIGRIMKAFHTLDVGSVLINQTPTYRIDNLPYGGTKDSGFGREGPRWAMEDMTELKTLVIRQV